ncbi:MAG TPA: aromatic amino acid hydroxylase [Polyangiales bacterium]|nr:aromatic amino acid hydroxylase [Polyangiales bacterium]
MDASHSVPPHLRQYVVTQDYDAYTERDQAVWRFVLLQTYARLARTGHPAYASGFLAAGISVDRIPRISEMNERLSEHGFGVVCVDGFIPPRAFQSFQANGWLPIAADIRTVEHLAYTPAPDIIHEAAGHAPFLPHPAYSRYLRRIGAVSEKAFADAYDRELYEAVYLLSEVKEDPASTAEQVAQAESTLAKLTRRATVPSEAARLARLYWWTVEYGLVGTPEDYRLYGAGLLSSLGEGHFCHEPRVKKLPLTAACIDVAYDITRQQPQLFVTRDFEHLERVLEDVEAMLGHKRGGLTALRAAQASGEPATLELDSGAELCGSVSNVQLDKEDQIAWIELKGSCAVGRDRAVHPIWPRSDGYVLPLGAAADGKLLSELSVADVRRRAPSGRFVLELSSGLRAKGQLVDIFEHEGRALGVLLADYELSAGDQRLAASRDAFPLLLSTYVRTAAADAPRGYYAETEFADRKVPKPRTYSAAQSELIALQEQARDLIHAQLGANALARIDSLYAVLEARYPDEWLLRWNLLAALVEQGSRQVSLAASGTGARGSRPAPRQRPALIETLEAQLEAMELRFQHREPIATGLTHLRGLGL